MAGVRERLRRLALTDGRLTRQRLDAFCREHATPERTLVVHSVDVDHRRHFPNAFVVERRADRPADLRPDAYYTNLDGLDTASFGVILCTGLLEHVPDPERLLDELRRILAPGGRLILSASGVFPFHGAPDNFFHFTPGGYRHLFRNWSRIEVLRGSTRPFETIAVLLQRITLQCEVAPPVRLVVELMRAVVMRMDRFVIREYDNLGARRPAAPGEGVMPATLFAVVVR